MHITVTGNNATATCGGCHTTGHRVTDMRTVRVATPTGGWGYAATWARHPNGPSYRRVSKRAPFPVTTTVTLDVCPGCAHRMDRARRAGVCTVRDVTE